MRPRLTVDATPCLFTTGGVGRATATLLSALAPAAPELSLTLYARRLNGAPLQKIVGAAKTKHLRLPKFCEPAMRFCGLIEKIAPADLYHATDHYLPLRLKANYLVTLHDLIFLTAPEKRWRIHRYLAKYVPAFARNARRIITCSECTKNDVVNCLAIAPEKIKVIPWGVDLDFFKPAADKAALQHFLRQALGLREPYLLAVACSIGRKNTPRLLAAWAQIAQKVAPHKLVLVWTPPPEIMAEHGGKPYSDSLRFTGKVAEPLLRALYQGARALVYPSLYEGFGLPVLEAMACATPVITSQTSSIPEVGGKLATYIQPQNTDEIAAAMLDFLQGKITPPPEDALVAHAQTFSWKNCAQQTLAVYRDCLSGS